MKEALERFYKNCGVTAKDFSELEGKAFNAQRMALATQGTLDVTHGPVNLVEPYPPDDLLEQLNIDLAEDVVF